MVAATVELFGVNPVERAVQHLCAAIRGEGPLTGDVRARDENIVVLDERNAAAVGAERGLDLAPAESVSRVAVCVEIL